MHLMLAQRRTAPHRMSWPLLLAVIACGCSAFWAAVALAVTSALRGG